MGSDRCGQQGLDSTSGSNSFLGSSCVTGKLKPAALTYPMQEKIIIITIITGLPIHLPGIFVKGRHRTYFEIKK